MFWNSITSGSWASPRHSGASANHFSNGHRRGSWSGGGEKEDGVKKYEPYSLGHLRDLFQRLIDTQEGRGDAGDSAIVEILRAISEVLVYGENQDAKVAARQARAAQAAVTNQLGEDGTMVGDEARGRRQKMAEGTGKGEDRVGRSQAGTENALHLLPTEIRTEDAFFELFCEKNMMGRFLALLRSPPRRDTNNASLSKANAWGTNGGLDAVVRAMTWGGGMLGIATSAKGDDRPQKPGVPGSGGSADKESREYREGAQQTGKGQMSSPEVQVQVIQTTSILVMNVKSDTSLFYLLSNNHVNDMILFDFQLDDEEVLSHFASFLKTLSLRLNPNTVQLFFRSPVRRKRLVAGSGDGGGGKGILAQGNEQDGRGAEEVGLSDAVQPDEVLEERREGEEAIAEGGAAEASSFPLYTRALEYICHGDFHVRIAALTVVLNIYNQRDPLVRAYLNGPAAIEASLPDRLVGALRSQCLVLADRAMAAGIGDRRGRTMREGGRLERMSSAMATSTVDPTICRDSIAGLQDQVFYLEDVFASRQSELNAQLCDHLVLRLVRPLLLGEWLSGRAGSMFPQVALCALAQLFIVVTYPPLVRLLVWETLGAGDVPDDVISKGAGLRESTGDVAPLLALLEGDKEELCMGALVVLQALVQNRVVRRDLGLPLAAIEDDVDVFGGDTLSPSTLRESTRNGFSSTNSAERSQCSSDANGIAKSHPDGQGSPSPASGYGRHSDGNTSGRTSLTGDASQHPLRPEVLDDAVEALCRVMAPRGPLQALTAVASVAGSWVDDAFTAGDDDGSLVPNGEQGGVDEVHDREGRETRRESGMSETGLRWSVLNGKSSPESSRGRRSSVPSLPPHPPPRRHHLVLRLCGKVLASLAPSSVEQETAAVEAVDDGSTFEDAITAAEAPAATVSGFAQGKDDQVVRARGHHAVDKTDYITAVATENGECNEGTCSQESTRHDAVLRRIAEAHSAAASAVVEGMGDAEGASIVVFEEEVREWSKRVGLDGAITNLPKMSSLILRWSLDNPSLPVTPASPISERNASPGGGCKNGETGEGVGDGTKARRKQRELRGSLQEFLEIRHVWRVLSGKGHADPVLLSLAGLGQGIEGEDPQVGGFLDLGGRECLACSVVSSPPQSVRGFGSRRSYRRWRDGEAAAGRGRSGVYLVLDPEFFLLATPDRRRLTNGEVRSVAPLVHLATAADPDDPTRLIVRALSHHPVALMRPMLGPVVSSSTGPKSADKIGGGIWRFGGWGGGENEGAGGGDAGSMCDMQAWACELLFENERSSRLAKKHMEGRRLKLRSEKLQRITEMLDGCIDGTED